MQIDINRYRHHLFSAGKKPNYSSIAHRQAWVASDLTRSLKPRCDILVASSCFRNVPHANSRDQP
jgi:hypothetical protein